jgi:replication-associated recombination protein RarA
LFARTSAERETIRLRSFAGEGDQWFTVSVADKTCNCPEFQRTRRCKHLTALGIHRLTPFTPTTHPTFSQALSGLVKSIRIRRPGDAIYWLLYLDTFGEPQYRFRTARRLLIGSAEDGHSIPVMENVAKRFWKLSKHQADLADLAVEAVRICKLDCGWRTT